MNNYLGFTLDGKYFVSKVPQPDEEQYTMVGPRGSISGELGPGWHLQEA
jgi:hypothetical protein